LDKQSNRSLAKKWTSSSPLGWLRTAKDDQRDDAKPLVL